ncbi:MAG TPA: xanthine dehydrogenase family protein molybdopterin-binding subunit [Gammaproteobacteria bacterium]|nr:xanthine dehydrogenase family protein molybdopterin-binding subunit [Gammaproteobacteria bacterium]
MSYIGRSVKRIEDFPLLSGRAKFVGDLSFSDQLHMRVVRSPVAFGRLLEIDSDNAQYLPGVVSVWTRDNVKNIPPIDFRQVGVEELTPYRQYVLAKDYVRYVGEPAAVVFAEDAYIAEDAAELVFLNIEELLPTREAIDVPGTFDESLKTEAAIIEKSYGNVDVAFETADRVIEMDLAVGRQSGVPLETRGLIARLVKESFLLEVYGAAKIPHINRDILATMLEIDSSSIQLFEDHVGGSFGIRGELYPEDVLVCLAAIKLGRPIKWIEDRREHLTAANHSRGQIHHIRAAIDDRGFISALDDEFWYDQGAYVRTHAATVPELTASMLPGPYVVPAYRSVGHIRLTNKTPAGTYRAPGRFEGTFVRERLMDEIARQLGHDPIEIRRVNFIPSTDMPFDRRVDALGTNVVYDSGVYEDLLDKLLTYVRYEELCKELDSRKRVGEFVGMGIACFVEKSGLGPFDDVVLYLYEDGILEIVTGAASVGQGVETILAQICADTLAVSFENIRVVHGQTDRISRGMGAFASRVSVMTGSAVHIAAEALRDKILHLHSKATGISSDNLTIVDGVIQDINDLSNGISLAEVVKNAPVADSQISNKGKALSVQSEFNSTHMTYPYGINLVVTRVDKDCAAIELERMVVAYDVGRAINPLLIEGQIVGGAVQGIGGALLEEFIYDESLQPLATSFMDYLLPTITESPHIELLLREDAPSGTNPLGIKGAGEGGITAVGAAVAAAVDDALGHTERVNRLPISAARMHEILKAKSNRSMDVKAAN